MFTRRRATGRKIILLCGSDGRWIICELRFDRIGSRVVTTTKNFQSKSIMPMYTTTIKHIQDEKKRKCRFVFVQEMSMKVTEKE